VIEIFSGGVECVFVCERERFTTNSIIVVILRPATFNSSSSSVYFVQLQ
jgi:hypothetical protein